MATQPAPLHLIVVEIKGFRGIRDGTLTGLAPLTVLVGPNSAGKSSVLEALYLVLTDRPTAGLFHCIRRRADLVEGARWLFLDHANAAVDFRVEATRSDNAKEWLEVKGSRPTTPKGGWRARIERFHQVAGAGISSLQNQESVMLPNQHAGALPDSPMSGGTPFVAEVRFIESLGSLSDVQLTDRLTQASEQGRRAEVHALLAEVLEGAQSLDIFTAGGTPYVGITVNDTAGPLGAVGDGVQLLVRQCLELAALPGGVALVEEPEAHKHPAALRATAKAIVGAVKRGVQVVLSTHSLELIDDLVSQADSTVLASMALFRLSLQDGVLLSSRLEGKDVQVLRADIQEDLR